MTNNTTTTTTTQWACGWLEVRAATAAAGTATASPADIAAALTAAVGQFLAFWARLAYNGPPAEMPAVPSGSDGHSIVEWAGRLLAAAYAAEGEMAPDARRRVAYAAGWQHPDTPPHCSRIMLQWDGTWTAGRRADVEFILDGCGSVTAVRVSWCSGTGERSSYLDIEGLLEALADADVAVGTALGFTPGELALEEFHENSF